MKNKRLKAKNKGKYFYYKGNTYRDLGESSIAISFYDQALEELENGDDDFTLCELHLDYAWLEDLRRDEVDFTQLKGYLDKGWQLAQKYHFGTEYSEYYHILYEISHYQGKDCEADGYLLRAIEYAYQYCNIYMQLDCLNHEVQMHYRQEKFDNIPEVIKNMYEIEKTGCKIRVFRGRAMLVQADVLFEKKEYLEALETYFEGFLIVALYGNSFTNVELFKDLYEDNNTRLSSSRRERINICLKESNDSKKIKRNFRKRWRDMKVGHEYDYFIDEMK